MKVEKPVTDRAVPTVRMPTSARSMTISSTSTSVTVTIPVTLALVMLAKPMVDTPISAS